MMCSHHLEFAGYAAASPWMTSLELITVSLLFSLALGGLDTDLLVVLLEGSQVLTGLGELTFLHTLTDVPVHERTLRVHQVELVVDAREHLGDSGGVRDHAHSAHHLRQVTTRHHGGGLVVDTALESGRRPVHELHGTLGLHGSHGGVHVLRDDVTAVHHAAGHVLTVTRVALDHHGGRLEHGVGQLSDGQLLVVCLLGRDDRRVRGQHKVDTRVRHQVGLELGHIDVQGTVEAQGRPM